MAKLVKKIIKKTREIGQKNKPVTVCMAVVVVLFGGILYVLLRKEKDDSYLEEVNASLASGEITEEAAAQKPLSKEEMESLGISSERETQKPRRRKRRKKPSGHQAVILHPDERKKKEKSLPIGTIAIGKILNAVDTRDTSSIVRVLLLYGIKGVVPKDSVLMGTASSRGKRIALNFHRLVLPDGSETAVKAQALDPKDFRPGITATHNGRTKLKIASSLTATMVEGVTSTLAKKEALGGEYGGVSVQNKLGDAALVGISKVAEREALRHAQEAQRESAREYLTLEPETAIIITLTETFNGGKLQ